MDKKYVKRLCALGMATVLTVGSTLSVYAYNNNTKKDNALATDETSISHEDIVSISDGAVDKNETVYVIGNSDGSIDKILVSDWLRNADKTDKLVDVSELSDIVNLKGDETFEKTADGIVWDAKGSDIYYQGTIEKTLPVDVRITYTLDGKEMTADELSGKSGHLVINFSYTNNQKAVVSISGKDTEVYVPYVVATGTVLSNDVYKNVSVKNARIVNDGDREMVLGIVLPGMQDDLGLDKSIFEIPESMEISADVTDFAPATYMTIVSNEPFSEIELKNTDSITELKDKLGILSESSNKLIAGAGSLYDGVESLSVGSQKLTEGMNSLNTGLVSLDSNSEALIAGAKKVFDTLLMSTAAQLEAAGINVGELTVDNYSAVLGYVISQMPDEGIALEGKKRISEALAQLDDYNRFYQGIIGYTDGVGKLKDGSSELLAGQQSLNEGIGRLLEGSKELSEGMTRFGEEGIGALVNALDQADIDGLTERIKAICELSKTYDSFSGKSDAMSGKVKFIYRF